jgi:hypothetical protein
VRYRLAFTKSFYVTHMLQTDVRLLKELLRMPEVEVCELIFRFGQTSAYSISNASTKAATVQNYCVEETGEQGHWQQTCLDKTPLDFSSGLYPP